MKKSVVWGNFFFLESIYTRLWWWAHAFRHQSSDAQLMLIIINVTSLCRLQTKLKPFWCIFILISLTQAYFPRLRWLHFTWTWFCVCVCVFVCECTSLGVQKPFHFITTGHLHFDMPHALPTPLFFEKGI